MGSGEERRGFGGKKVVWCIIKVHQIGPNDRIIFQMTAQCEDMAEIYVIIY